MRKISFVFIAFFTMLFIFVSLISGLDISGKTYLYYYYNLSQNKADINGFDISRAYLIFKEKIDESKEVKITTDVGRDSSGIISLFLKYANITFKGILPDINLIFGLLETPWIGFEEKIWEHRFVSAVFVDLEKKLNSADLGLSLSGKLADNIVEYIIAAVNGEGYKKAEINKFKDLQGRLTISPLKIISDDLKNIKISGFYSYGKSDENNERKTSIGFISYQNDLITIAAEDLYVNENNKISRGFGGFGIIKLDKLSIFERIEQFEPDINIGWDKYTRIISGISYKLNEKVVLALDNQLLIYENTNKINNNLIYLNVEINY